MTRILSLLFAAWVCAGTGEAQEVSPTPISQQDASPGFNDKFDDRFELVQAEGLERLCGVKAIRTLPLESIPIVNFSVHRMTLHMEGGYFTAQVPLLKPQGEMAVVYWNARSLDDAMTFFRLLQGGTIKALGIETRKPEFRSDRPKPSMEDIRTCQTSRVQDLLMPCTECRIRELVIDNRTP